MEIVNIRIDDRLIHGQVATVWIKFTKATRIMVIDDEVVKDQINKEALKMACPKQCKLSILTVEKAVNNINESKYDGERIFVIVKGPKTLCKLYDAGFDIKEFNIGNMAGNLNTKMLVKSVSVSEDNIKDFLYLDTKGIKITAQMVPSDEKINFIKIIKEV
ncbi:PTS sugar transporter subunit IIB [Sneathia vaginalis]|jgi:hypothetical protein|uniref:PTS mannose transporter subunit IIAB n=1 Tax=Sneathia vaginalis TaxID=187101 RepID=A0A0E3UTP9_9FUSO|nr:PTS sugar transporter subunit IIB [Sneathia vaginalis]AKC95364.1 PTS mannose transporter subunit IIAB [Sneathia vaginalis]